MFRAQVTCTGIPTHAGPAAAAHVTAELAQHGPGLRSVSCTWDGLQLTLIAESESENAARAISDQFFECLAPFVRGVDIATSYKIRET